MSAGAPAAAALDEVYERYLDALRRGQRRSAFEAIDAGADQGLDMSALYLGVFQPALREIGRLWEENEISVADEHLATAITQSAMARLFDRLFRWPAAAQPTIVAACADTERHEVGLRMLCDLLETRGWEAHFLGACVPAESLVRMVQEKRPQVVALSAALAPHLPRLRAMIAAVRGAFGPAAPIIIVGGRQFLAHPELAQQVGADLTAGDAATAVTLLEQRVARR